eukprot:COSAG02_NODE_397_length_23124_cov_439.255635_9_plen_198_part_00
MGACICPNVWLCAFAAEGPDLQSAFVRFCGAIGQVEESFSKSSLEFMTHEHLGYLTTDPSNIGTGLRASLMMRLPHMIQRPDFLKIVAQLRLEARPAGTLDQWETTGDWPKLFGDTTSSLGAAAGVGFGDTLTSHNSSTESIGYGSDEEQQERNEQVDDEERDTIQTGGGAVRPNTITLITCVHLESMFSETVGLHA